MTYTRRDPLRAMVEPARSPAGQVLPLFALFLVALLGMAALAIDVSRAYADLRLYRSAADAAALAGAQDLQVAGTRQVTAGKQSDARAHALLSLEQRLGGSGSLCGSPDSNIVDSNIVDCRLAGTPYVVSIKTPSPTCSSCVPLRSVQVTVRHPNYGLTFARVLGSDEWDVGTTSVAGLDHGKSYAIMTLRPPKKLGSTFDVKDITLDGGTVVTVDRGDVGTNSNMNYSGSGSAMILDEPDYGMYYFDPLSGPQWGPSPVGQKLTTLMDDPDYRYPVMAGAPTYADARTSEAGSVGSPVTQASVVGGPCEAEAAKVDPARYTFMATQPADKIFCYEPGIYDSSNNRAQIVVGTGEVALLKPGAYYLKKGLDVGGRLIGGYEAGSRGVALMFDECLNTCIFAGNNALTIALNAGTRFPPTYGGGAPATAALDWSNQKVETSGPSGPTTPLPITLLVKPDTGCYVPTPPQQLIEPSGCDAGRNKTINIAGSGQIVLEGVQYTPTDNVEISGSSSSDGRVGQIISWTLKYSGGIRINQEGPGFEGNGILRIDAACSAPGEPCSP